MKRIYLDDVATTPTDPEVVKAGKKRATLKRISKYSFKIKIICFAAYALATLAWLNEVIFHQFEGSILLSRYTEYFLIVGFGIWRAWKVNLIYES